MCKSAKIVKTFEAISPCDAVRLGAFMAATDYMTGIDDYADYHYNFAASWEANSAYDMEIMLHLETGGEFLQWPR